MSVEPAVRRREVQGITGLRYLPQDAAATLVNISSTGLLAESFAKVQVGAYVTVAIDGGFSPSIVSGRAVRCEVAVMGRDGLLRYHTAVEFDTPIRLDRADAGPPAPTPHVRNRW